MLMRYKNAKIVIFVELLNRLFVESFIRGVTHFIRSGRRSLCSLGQTSRSYSSSRVHAVYVFTNARSAFVK